MRTTRSLEWDYVLFTIGAFIFTPEIRRLTDWAVHTAALSVLAVIPLVMLCPIIIMAFRRRNRLRRPAFTFIIVTWFVGFLYAALVAAAFGTIAQALYALGDFCLPAVVGVWLMTRDETMQTAYTRLSKTFLVFGAIAATYAIFQYVIAPPWDTAWMQQVTGDSFGLPERFEIRVWGVLNAPGIFAFFISSVITFTLPYLRSRSWRHMLALSLMTISLMLSLERAAWLALLAGIIIFVFLSPKRLKTLASLSITIGVCSVAVMALLFASPDKTVSYKLSQRLDTLSDVTNDASGVARRQTAESTFEAATDNLAGAGLGITGQSGQLGSPDSSLFRHVPSGLIDNGFASRFFEMGLPGFAAFIVSCFSAIGVTINRYCQLSHEKNQAGMLVSASCVTTLIVLFSENIAGDVQQSLLGVLFFVALAVPLMRSQKAPTPAPIRETGKAKLFKRAKYARGTLKDTTSRTTF